jgi:hypothetical protein
MPEEFAHKCIKCQRDYKDNDVDDYYCLTCKEERKKIAQQVDAKIAARGPKKQVKSDLQIYNDLCKMRGTAFVPIKAWVSNYEKEN